MSTKRRGIVSLLVALALPQVAGGVGAIPTRSAIPDWYADLRKPSWQPPNWIFGPVWIMLYLLMGIASLLVWRKGSKGKATRFALTLYGLQLVANTAWSLLFFGSKRLGWAFAEIVALWALIAATLTAFWRIDRRAGLLLVPYQVWVSFAGVLNAAIWRMNR